MGHKIKSECLQGVAATKIIFWMQNDLAPFISPVFTVKQDELEMHRCNALETTVPQKELGWHTAKTRKTEILFTLTTSVSHCLLSNINLPHSCNLPCLQMAESASLVQVPAGRPGNSNKFTSSWTFSSFPPYHSYYWCRKKKKSNCLVSWHCCLSMLAQAKRLGWNWLRRAAQVQGRALWRLLLPGGLRQPPKHTMQQSLCTDSKGVRYRLPPESRCPEIISSVSIHVVFGVIPLEQDWLTLLGTTHLEPQQNAIFLRALKSC